MRKNFLLAVVLIPAVCLCAAGFYYLPPVHDRLAWRVDEAVLRVQYQLRPPAKQVFTPQQQPPTSIAQLVWTATPTPASPTRTLPATAPVLQETPSPSPTPSASPTPLPPQVMLSGVIYEDQHGRWNYCAPANLAMALSFWGWQGNRDVVGPVLKPLEKDKNVMPYEMVDYVNERTDLRAVLRLAGDVELLKRFISAGFPVLVEKGAYLRDLTGVVSWMGHYQVVTGYDDAGEYFIAQDSFIKPDHKVSYADMISGWRAFNYTYIIIYPPEKEAQVFELLGADADETANAENAALKASAEIFSLSGIDQYFAWFNRGSSLVKLQDYAGASLAYDEAFKVYPTIPEDKRPWRMMWYQTGPYFAYFYAQRYYDVLYLADGTLNAMQSDKNLEESYYWRGMARAALGDTANAVEDFRLSLQYHPGFPPALYQLQVLGVSAP
jgi:tetratricopeptide (TPR) repeat protein